MDLASFPPGSLAPGRRGPLWLAILLLLAWATLPARAMTEYEIKAAFLFNFAKFFEWPPSAFAETSSPLVLGIVGDDPFGPVLPATLEHETVKGRSIKIQHFQPGEDFAGCHLLFISHSAASETKTILERNRGRSVLTVSETDTFLAQGGMINFVLVNKSVRFDINTQPLAHAGLKVSSKLLAVARSVKE